MNNYTSLSLKKSEFQRRIRILTFCLIIFQSVGIRFFNGQGIVLGLIILTLNFSKIKLINARDFRFFLIAVIFLILSVLLNSSFSFVSFVYQILLLLSALLLLVQYKGRSHFLQEEFFIALKFFAIYTALGYVIYIIQPNAFQIKIGLNRSLSYLFYVSYSSFAGIRRNTGPFWEPGVMQLIMNLFLFYCIKFKRSLYLIILGVLLVVSSFSTTGLFVVSFNFLYYIYMKYRSRQIRLFHILGVIFLLSFFIPILNQNANEKLDNQNTSALVRLRDFQIGLDLIKEKPILGHGVFDADYLSSKRYVRSIESDIFTEGYLEDLGDMSGGYTNGILGLIAWYGIPVSLLLYYFFYNNNFIGKDRIERLFICIIFLVSMISEPIAYTSLFLLFPLSYWVLKFDINRLAKI